MFLLFEKVAGSHLRDQVILDPYFANKKADQNNDRPTFTL
jgi:hypothetical protein